eukprot:14882335-Ditylum_brightwellii.AAC.1
MVCEVIHNGMASMAEAEIGALHSNTRKGEELCLALTEMGHPQPPTPVLTDNSTACGIVNKTVKQQRTCAIDMHFYWVCDRCAQGQFLVYWGPGKDNLGDYHTKHHSVTHHQKMRPMYLHTSYGVLLSVYTNPRSLRGCVKLGKIQPTRADNPKRSTANNDVIGRTWSIPGYPDDVIFGNDVATAANAVLR